jgi:hypothetical protein
MTEGMELLLMIAFGAGSAALLISVLIRELRHR